VGGGTWSVKKAQIAIEIYGFIIRAANRHVQRSGVDVSDIYFHLREIGEFGNILMEADHVFA
jgi:hypothetical protein